MFQIIYHRRKCIGCNACVEAAPNRWRVSRKDGKCTLVNGVSKKGIYKAEVSMDEYEKNQLAAANCPVKIIQLKLI